MPESSTSPGLHIGIDATNIRQGGGVTHLSQILSATILEGSGIARMTVWCGSDVSRRLPDFPWLIKLTPSWANASLPFRMLGQQLALGFLLKAAGCDVLFSPGGTIPYFCGVPTVTMSQNMLPFEDVEADRFGRWSPMWLKMQLLKVTQGNSFKNSDGLIFLTEYAQTTVLSKIGPVNGLITTIPHGIEERFRLPPRLQRRIEDATEVDPFRLLYVSIMMPYKHQIEVARAVGLLRAKGIPLSIRFVGSDWGVYGREFRATQLNLDPDGKWLHWDGALAFEDLHSAYQMAEAFVFASSCENLPNILIESMSASLPIVCSKSGPMPEVLGDAGVYFRADEVTDIASALRVLLSDPDLRAQNALRAFVRSANYSWSRCASDTFSFINSVARRGHQIN